MSVKTYPFIVTRGHQVASGKAKNSPYPEGTIALQAPYFKNLGLDLTPYFKGTINAQFACQKVELLKWDLEFNKVTWLTKIPSENFRFAHGNIVYRNEKFPCLIYQPIAETKLEHFQPANTLELLAPKIAGITYGSKATLEIPNQYLSLR